MQLEVNVEDWKTILAKEITENRQPITNGSGLPFPEQIAPSTSATQPMRPPLTSGPQVDLSLFEGPEMESAPIGAPQGILCLLVVSNWVPHHSVVHKGVIVFRPVLSLMRHPDKEETMKMIEMVVMLDRELHKCSNRGIEFEFGNQAQRPSCFSWTHQ